MPTASVDTSAAGNIADIRCTGQVDVADLQQVCCRPSARKTTGFQVQALVDSQTHAQPETEFKRPADLTQALAVAGFLAVRYGSAQVDAHLILKCLAALQLVVAAIAMTMRKMQTDRVRGPTAQTATCSLDFMRCMS